MISDLIGFAGIITVLILALIVFSIMDGFANTVDNLALWLHRQVVTVRRRHAVTTARVNEQWIRQVEADGEPEPLLIIPYGGAGRGRTARSLKELEQVDSIGE